MNEEAKTRAALLLEEGYCQLATDSDLETDAGNRKYAHLINRMRAVLADLGSLPRPIGHKPSAEQGLRAEPPSVEAGTEVFTGYFGYEGTLINTEFEVPKGASDNEKDAAYLAALSQIADVNYLAMGDFTSEPRIEKLPASRRA